MRGKWSAKCERKKLYPEYPLRAKPKHPITSKRKSDRDQDGEIRTEWLVSLDP
jgi:hypothetical protein